MLLWKSDGCKTCKGRCKRRVNPVLLKIGGSVLTDKRRECTFNMQNIRRIAGEVARASVPTVIVHGAGSFGHPQAKKHHIQQNPGIEGVIKTHRAVLELNTVFVETLQEEGVAAIGVHPLNCLLAERGIIKQWGIEIIKRMVDFGVTPVIHGDVVMDTINGISVISGDRILTHLAKTLDVAVIGAGTVVDGVLDKNGRTIPYITPSNFKEVSDYIGGSTGDDVTGGMRGKVVELLKLAESGTRSVIFNAGLNNMVFSFLSGETIPATHISGAE